MSLQDCACPTGTRLQPFDEVPGGTYHRAALNQQSHGRAGLTVTATDLLYQLDSYARAFDAVVVAVDDVERAVALDRSAFYPGGGGQPFDTGVLTFGDARSVVASCAKRDGVVWHKLAPEQEMPSVGTAIHGELDWEPRYKLMRTHTALHALCGTIFRDYGALVTGGNMAVDRARMDFEMEEFNPARVAEIERRVNEELGKRRPIRVRIVPREEAFAIPDLIRTKINLLPEGIAEVRIVEIEGLDLQADGGTHVANTDEVGAIKVVGTRSKGKSNKRLEIVLTGKPGDPDPEHLA